MARYELPRLPYGYDELEPHVDGQTMRIHHLGHHRHYTDGLNDALDRISASSHPRYIASVLADIGSVPAGERGRVAFFGGGYENHRVFWESMTPGGGGGPGGRLADAIDVYFGGFGRFRELFSARAGAVRGSGWCWLVLDPSYGRIEVMATADNGSPWAAGRVPLLGLDVWEHAYYLRHQHRRHDYVESWWNTVNWEGAEGRFSGYAA